MANIVIIFKEGLIIMIAHGKKIKIFTGNSHPELAKEIADFNGCGIIRMEEQKRKRIL